MSRLWWCSSEPEPTGKRHSAVLRLRAGYPCRLVINRTAGDGRGTDGFYSDGMPWGVMRRH